MRKKYWLALMATVCSAQPLIAGNDLISDTLLSVAAVDPVRESHHPQAGDPEEDKPDVLEYGGAIVLQYNSTRSVAGRFGTDPYAYLALTLTPHPRFELYTLLLQTREFGVNEAVATWHVGEDGKLDVSFGREYLPFGSFESAMVSYPLTQVQGSIRGEEVLKLSTQWRSFDSAVYAFEGASSVVGTDQQSHGYGLRLSYGNDNGYLGLDYISNLAETSQFSQEAVGRDIPGLSLHGEITFGRFTLLTEYITTARTLKPGDLGGEISVSARPSSWNLEMDIDLDKERTLAIAWNETNDTDELVEDATRRMVGMTYSQPIYKALSGAIEVAQFTDPDGGKEASLNLQLVLEF